MPRLSFNPRVAVLAWGAATAATACGGDSGSLSAPAGTDGFFSVKAPPGGRAEFSAFPVDMTADGTIEPLAHLAPPGHTIPTDHVYFYAVNYDRLPQTPDTITRPVYAPATGAVAMMLQPSGTDWKVEVVVTDTFGYYLDHIHPRAGLAVGDIVKAGEVVGTTNPGGSIDLGAWDFATPVLGGFVNPARYGLETLHCVSPFKYYVEPLRAQLYARQRRMPGADPDPRIDVDIAGQLAGNWFEQSVSIAETNGPVGWPKSLAFVYDNYDPSKIRISIGGTVDAEGLWTIDGDAPRPADVGVSLGKVSYRLRYTGSTSVQYGLMIVQMLADNRIQVEVFPGSQAATADFDAKAFVYVR